MGEAWIPRYKSDILEDEVGERGVFECYSESGLKRGESVGKVELWIMANYCKRSILR